MGCQLLQGALLIKELLGLDYPVSVMAIFGKNLGIAVYHHEYADGS